MSRKQKPRGLVKGEYVLIHATCTTCRSMWSATGTPPKSMAEVRNTRQQAKFHAASRDHNVEIIVTKVGTYVRPETY